MNCRSSASKWFRAALLGFALFSSTGVTRLLADDPKPDPNGGATGVAADVPGFIVAAPVELSADENKDKDKVKTYAEAKKAAAIEAERKKRDAASGKPPTTLDRAPQAGTATPSGVDAQLDNLPISDLEDTLARMPADKLDQYLASAPGGLRDNPRAG